jgi:hypothetical protein
VCSLFEVQRSLGRAILLMRNHCSVFDAVNQTNLKAVEADLLDDAGGILDNCRRAAAFQQSGNFNPYESANIHMWLDETTRHFRGVFLWYERRRLNRNFSSIRKYAHAFPDLGKEGVPLKNAACNLRTFGLRALPGVSAHPRIRLYAAVLLLLDDSFEPSEVRRVLHSAFGTFENLYGEFCDLQQKFG